MTAVGGAGVGAGFVVDGEAGASSVFPGVPSACAECVLPFAAVAPVALAGIFSPAAPIVATTLLTGTVSPSFTAIAISTPAAGDGISASTLSVEISKSGSSRSTESPTFLIQRTMVPSAIDSPIWGMTTGVDIKTYM